MDETIGKNHKTHSSAPGKTDPDEGVDEFLDDSADDYDDSSWDEGGDSDDSGFSEPPAKKKKAFLSFNVIVIGIAIVFGGGFVLMQMAKRGNSVQSAEVVAPVSRLQMTGMTDNPVFKDVRKDQGASLPIASGQPSSLPSPEKSPSSPGPIPDLPPVGTLAEPGDASKTGSREPSDVLTPLPPGEAESHDPLAAFRKKKPDSSSGADTVVSGKEPGNPPLDLPVKAQDLSAGRGAGVPAVPVEDVSRTGLSDPVSAGSSVKTFAGEDAPVLGKEQEPLPVHSSREIDGVRKAVSDLEARLAGIESRVTGLSEKAEKTSGRPPASISSDPEIVALKETIAKLERALSEVSGKADRSLSLKEEGVGSRVNRSLPSKERTKKPAVQSVKPVVKAPSSDASENKSSNPRWEIRAIQPGVAWVAPVGGDDMQTIGVGDSLPGLGVIRSISVVDGVWTVEGTGGRLRQ